MDSLLYKKHVVLCISPVILSIILAPLIQAQGVPTQLADTSAEALQKARKQAGETDVILVSGSLSFLAEYLQLESGDENNGASR